MKKIISLFLVFILSLFIFTSCSNGDNNASVTVGNEQASSSEKKLSIVTTIFPEYDWVKQLLGSKTNETELTMLLDSGVDLHSYQPTADDIIKISSCDMFIYVGGESDEWVQNALKQADNENMTVINLLDVLGDNVKEEEIKEGMQEDEEEPEEAEEAEYDEHVWLSLKNAKALCAYIAQKLGEIDKTNADIYKSNCDSYLSLIDELDNQYETAVNEGARKTLLFADRFPFRYLADDYSLDYYAAFAGCSAETEASFETVAFLAEKVDELGLSSVLTIDGTDHKIAETVVSSTKEKNQSILSMNSMQSVTSKDVENGADYISIMRKNLETLKQALA